MTSTQVEDSMPPHPMGPPAWSKDDGKDGDCVCAVGRTEYRVSDQSFLVWGFAGEDPDAALVLVVEVHMRQVRVRPGKHTHRDVRAGSGEHGCRHVG
jgi:hypothetical protein